LPKHFKHPAGRALFRDLGWRAIISNIWRKIRYGVAGGECGTLRLPAAAGAPFVNRQFIQKKSH